MKLELEVGDIVANGVETYEIVEQLTTQHSDSKIYHVRCKTGRHRNRHLALKKIRITASLRSAKYAATALHQALHHPNIVSLLSAFTTNQDTFHVMELCSAGNLFELLQSRPGLALSEPELRGVTKSLADALAYLRKELIVHGNINPSNILFTSDYRLKLSDFEYSARLPNDNLVIENPIPPSCYTAPELASGRPHNFSADIWSLGCVMTYCLTGMPQFETDAPPMLHSKVAQLANHLPEHLSEEAKALISGTLQISAEDRIYVPDILSHPFIAHHMPVISLRHSIDIPKEEKIPHQKLNADVLRLYCKQFAESPPTSQASPAVKHADILSSTTRIRARFPLANISNINLKTASDQIASLKQVRRVVSDPLRLPTTFPTQAENSDDETPTSFFSLRANTTVPVPRTRSRGIMPSEPSGTASLETVTKAREMAHALPHSDVQRIAPLKKFEEQHLNPLSQLPVGTERPSPLNTLSMACQTHKTIYGQVTILPSHSLLIDFREGQRRKGFKGDEVLVIDPDGLKVSVYSAPHLSSPSCLVEPTEQFSIQTLPSVYWKQYNDAARLVNQIKQRTPALIVHLAAAKCVLMANEPQGDIEILFTCPSTLLSKVQASVGRVLRIRFSRRSQSIEIARHISGVEGEEWTKKNLVSVDEPPYVSTEDWKVLEQDEKDALHRLTLFVNACGVVEDLIIKARAPLKTFAPAPSTSQDGKKDSYAAKPPLSSCTSTITNAFSSFSPAPRPSKLTTATSAPTPDLTYDTDTIPPIDVHINAEGNLSDAAKSSRREDFNVTTGRHGIQTRFIPSVGWCIRYASCVSQGGRYRLMFFDGVALDVDVDEEWVEFKSQTGEITTYNIRECASKRTIGDRMKVFEEFVSMFDDSEDE